MISLHSKQFLETNIKGFIIPSEKVAHVQIGNSLEHALLVLTKSGYSAIPVLDTRYKFNGLISSSMITDSILGLERIEFELLEGKKVEEVMVTNIPRISIDAKFEEIIELLVDHPFLCVIKEDGYFEGIMTRRIALKQLNRHIHRLNHFL
jgi:predicted transcriptional regulator